MVTPHPMQASRPYAQGSKASQHCDAVCHSRPNATCTVRAQRVRRAEHRHKGSVAPTTVARSSMSRHASFMACTHDSAHHCNISGGALTKVLGYTSA